VRKRLLDYLLDFGGILVVLAAVAASIIPLYWMTVTSIKPDRELLIGTAPLWVFHPTVKHYQYLLRFTPFGRWFANSVFVASITTAVALFLGALAAYAISRIPSRFNIRMTQLTLLSYLIPRAVFVVPLYNLLSSLRLLDTLWGLALAYLSFTLPFSIWLLLGFFQNIPREIDEAALIDGCSRWGALLRVILPLLASGMIATCVYCFSMSWNEFMYPLALVQTQARNTITVGIASMKQGDILAWGPIMAAGTLGSIPVLVFYAFIYKKIVGGLVAGSIKG
jgi:multiple sugar transport system permease protein